MNKQSSRRSFIKSIAGISASLILPTLLWFNKNKISGNNMVSLIDPEKSKDHLIKTGLFELDNKLDGFHPGQLYVIGGRPATGKTALALTILGNIAINDNVSAGLFSLEMSKYQVATRLLCMVAKVDFHLMRTANLSKTQLKDIFEATKCLEDTSIIIDDTADLSVIKMMHNAKQLKAEHDIKIIIVDYLQLLGIEICDSRKNKMKLICRSLKMLAVELDMPIIVTFHLLRTIEEQEEKRQMLNDFLIAPGIQESADTILLLHRPWIYTHKKADKEKAEIIITKNVNGPTGVVKQRFIDKYMMFEQITNT